jgi:hypothetical protein
MSANEPSVNAHQPGDAPDWWVYRGTGRPMYDIDLTQILPPPPPWRNYGGPLPSSDGHPPEDDGEASRRLGSEFHLTEQHIDPHELDMVNASLYLRRPLLLTGKPGVGKSALAYRIARELRLGRVLKWSISTHTTLRSGLYRYDAIGRLQAAATRPAAIRPRGGFPDRRFHPAVPTGNCFPAEKTAARSPDRRVGQKRIRPPQQSSEHLRGRGVLHRRTSSRSSLHTRDDRAHRRSERDGDRDRQLGQLLRVRDRHHDEQR